MYNMNITNKIVSKSCFVVVIYPYLCPTNLKLEVSIFSFDEKINQKIVVGNYYTDEQVDFFISNGTIVLNKLAEEIRVLSRLTGKQVNRVKKQMMKHDRSDKLFCDSQSIFLNKNWVVENNFANVLGTTFL